MGLGLELDGMDDCYYGCNDYYAIDYAKLHALDEHYAFAVEIGSNCSTYWQDWIDFDCFGNYQVD